MVYAMDKFRIVFSTRKQKKIVKAKLMVPDFVTKLKQTVNPYSLWVNMKIFLVNASIFYDILKGLI